jgi:hypothetical protein
MLGVPLPTVTEILQRRIEENRRKVDGLLAILAAAELWPSTPADATEVLVYKLLPVAAATSGSPIWKTTAFGLRPRTSLIRVRSRHTMGSRRGLPPATRPSWKDMWWRATYQRGISGVSWPNVPRSRGWRCRACRRAPRVWRDPASPLRHAQLRQSGPYGRLRAALTSAGRTPGPPDPGGGPDPMGGRA